MTERDKKNLFLFGGIALAILLLFLWRGKSAGNTTVIQQGDAVDTTVPAIDVPDYVLNLPPLNYHSSGAANFTYQGGNTSFGCAMCAGIGSFNILPISPPVEVKTTQDEPKIVVQTIAAYPPSTPSRAMVFSSGAAAPAKSAPVMNAWWAGSAPGGPIF